jgi:GTP pyrophosphokinase
MSNSSRLTLMRPSASEMPVLEASLAPLVGPLPAPERERVRAAWALAESRYPDVVLANGEAARDHALRAAAIVLELQLDGDAIAAALLVPVAGADPGCLRLMTERCGAGVADLVEGVVRMAQIGALSRQPREAVRPEQQALQHEVLRRMLLAMVQDVRVVLVKLADHLQELRFAVKSDADGLRRETARLTHDVFAPLASRLGMWQLKWEMEDLAFRVLEPETYARIARLLDGKRRDRERYIEHVTAQLAQELTRGGIAAVVTGRPKHIFSIYKKLFIKGIDFESLYDVRAVRVLVRDVTDCYATLGLVHNLWTPIPEAFDDYIAQPKSNQYRSLHTAVVGPEGKTLEVQIRTQEMHQHAELGIAAHWRYKEGSRHEQGYDRRIAWLRQVLEWKDEVSGAGELAGQLRIGLAADAIYVLTPQGKIVDLPPGATPVDFAYHVHTELGHRCRGAKVDGAMVPLNTLLANGQQIEILAAKQGGPSRDWLNPQLGYAKSQAARAKIRQWFNRRNHDAAVAQGRALVEKELQRQGLTSLGLDQLAAQLDFDKAEDLLAEVGRGEIRGRQLERAVHALDPRAHAPDGERHTEAPVALPGKRPRAPASGSVRVVGVDRLLTVTAGCCKPAPRDEIVGFVTRGRGVTIHRVDCANVMRLDPERRVTAEWGESAGASFPVDIEIEATDRAGLLRDISDVLARERLDVRASHAVSRDATARMNFTVGIIDLGQLDRVLALVRNVRGVMHAARRRQPTAAKEAPE